MPDRALAQKVTSQHYKHDRPADWFDKLYNAAAGDANRIPWGDCAPNPSLLGWKSSHAVAGSNAVVVGCGLGDDAEEVGRWNLKTLAFDISPRAVEWCRRRFPQSAVEYTVGDLFALPKEWVGAFDFVLEIYTVQSLPPEYREHVLASLASLVAPGGSC